MSETKKIFSLIPKIMAQVGVIEKNRTNSTQGSGYKFRGIDDVYAALQPVLSQNAVFFAPEVLDQIREERTSRSGGQLLYTILKIRFTFFADDGSSFPVITVGEAMDSGDKSANKAMSAALKYALLQVFCIPTEEPKDTENETHEVTPRVAQQQPTESQQGPKPIPRWTHPTTDSRPCSHCNSLNTMVDRYNQNELYCKDCKKKTPLL